MGRTCCWRLVKTNAGPRDRRAAGATALVADSKLTMPIALPALNLKAKLILLMVGLLALTLGAEVVVSLRAEEAIILTTQRKVKDLASVIQISVQELTSVEATDRDRLQSYVTRLQTQGLEVSIASDKDLIINSSNPKLIGAAVNPEVVRTLMSLRGGSRRVAF